MDALYRRYAGVVFRRVLSFYPPQEAEEITQEVFVKVLERLDSFRGDASAVTWLYRVATNHCLTRLRDQKNRQRLLREQGPALAPDTSADGQDAFAQVLLGQLWRELPADLLDYAVYYHLDGLTHAQIAQLMGVSRRTVGNRLEELEAIARAL